jgi:hypothetical protein
VSAQKVATAVGLAALAALFLSVGLPALLPPDPVARIEIVVGEDDEPHQPEPTRLTPPGRLGDDSGDDDSGGDDSGGGDTGGAPADPDDSPDDSADDSADD